MGIETGVTARPATRRFFGKIRWALTLAPRRNRRIRSLGFRALLPAAGARPRRGLRLNLAPARPAVANPLAVPPALVPPAGLAPFRGPISLPATPGTPTPGRLPTGLTAIPRLRMLRLERLLAPLQQAPPTPRTPLPLNTRRSPAMLGRAQGRCELPKGQVAVRNVYSAPRRLLPDGSAACTPPYREPLKPPSANRTLAPVAPQKWLPPWPPPTGMPREPRQAISHRR